MIGGYALPGQQQYPVTFESAGGETGLPEQPAHPMGGAVGGACGGQLAEKFLSTMNKTSDRNNFSKLRDGTVEMRCGIYAVIQTYPPKILKRNIFQNII